jgi:cyclomaltodextrinase / maltogenic alpha-amylase / neopullulanase
MAKKTDLSLRSYTFYQVFPRQHSKTKDFKGVIDDLDRIKNLGVDVIYLLPIHPIGKKARKGIEGSPYSIVDYLEVHKDLGTIDDFKTLVLEARKRNLKVMIDIVFNHTSRDSKLVFEKPEWFYKNEKNEFANRVGDWSDITDLNFVNRGVWDYLIDVLKYWATMVDGFRCDVAPLLPLDFWLEAREKVDQINPNLIWLTESVHPGFIKYLRDQGYDCYSDSEMYQAFDICYDYDIYDYMNDYLKDPKKLSKWIEEIERQETIYPKNYVKLRSFENHDQPRLRSKVRDHDHFMMMLALNFFLKGAAFIYAGQEHEIDVMPDLFNHHEIIWNEKNSVEPYIKRLASLKKQPIFIEGNFNIHHKVDVVLMSYHYQHQFLIGIFNLEQKDEIDVPLIDGTYLNFITDTDVIVKNGKIKLDNNPIIIDTLKEHIK